MTISSATYGPATLTPNTYCFTSSVSINGVLTLNALGDGNAVFYLITSPGTSISINSNILTTNGANPCNVFIVTPQSVNINTIVTIHAYILSSQTISTISGVKIVGGLMASGNVNPNSLTVTMCITTACPAYFLCPLNLGNAANITVISSGNLRNSAGGTTTGNVASAFGSISAYPPGTLVGGVKYVGTSQATNALTTMTNIQDAVDIYPCTHTLGTTLSGTITQGVYCAPGSLTINAVLTLNAQGNSGSVFYIISQTTLTINANIIASNGTLPCNVYITSWASQLTVSSNVQFVGIVSSWNRLTLNNGANVVGRLSSLNNEVRLNNNIITPCSATGCVAGCTNQTCAPSSGACCVSNSQCYFTSSYNCTLLNGVFNANATSCNSTICQAPINLSRFCFINSGGSCTTYFSYYSFNTITLNISSTLNNYFSCNGVNMGNVGQPTLFLPGNQTRIWMYNSTGCLNCTWTVNTGG